MRYGESSERLQIVLPKLWPHQQEFVDDVAQFTVCKSATKCGKTMAGAWWLAREVVRHPGELFWWVGPTNDVGLIGYQTVLALLEAIVVKEQQRPWKFKTENGAAVSLKTAQEPDYLRGAGVSGMVLDEAGSPQFDLAWGEIRTTISATRGKLKIIGNPGDAGHFLDKAERWGLDPNMPEWTYRAWKFLDRPTATAADLDQARRELGEDSPEFKRYYLGETIRGAGSFFYNLDGVFTGQVEEAVAGEEYVMGVDTAIKSDYFVASVFRERDRRQVYYSRYKGPPAEQQEDEIARVAGIYNNPPICIEVNGPGGPIAQRLEGRGLRVHRFETSGKSKPTILYDYRSDLSHGSLTLLDDEYQKHEHLSYQMRTTNFGTVKFGSPHGGNDDMVMANAFANNALRRVTSAELTWVC